MIAADFARSLRLAGAVGVAGDDSNLTGSRTAISRANRRRSAAAAALSKPAAHHDEVVA